MNREKAQYPQILSEPTAGDVISNFHARDWAQVAGLTSVCGIIGYSLGEPFRKPPMVLAAWIGFTGGMTLGYQDSAARLLGFKYNRKECRKYGVRYYKRELRVKQTQPHEEINPSSKDAKAKV